MLLHSLFLYLPVQVTWKWQEVVGWLFQATLFPCICFILLSALKFDVSDQLERLFLWPQYTNLIWGDVFVSLHVHGYKDVLMSLKNKQTHQAHSAELFGTAAHVVKEFWCSRIVADEGYNWSNHFHIPLQECVICFDATLLKEEQFTSKWCTKVHAGCLIGASDEMNVRQFSIFMTGKASKQKAPIVELVPLFTSIATGVIWVDNQGAYNYRQWASPKRTQRCELDIFLEMVGTNCNIIITTTQIHIPLVSCASKHHP